MVKKAFFQERTARQIQSLNPKRVYNQRGLVERIDDLSPEETLEIRTRITPGRFFQGKKTGEEASGKAYKHGDFLRLSHPKTQKECYECSEIPLATRARDFSQLQEMREGEINFIGYSTQTTFGDRIKRVFPFVWMPEGARVFAYAEQMPEGIEVKTYGDAKRVRREGADVVVTVPSRREKLGRYRFRLLHVPIIRGRENLATVLQLKPALIVDEETGEPESQRTPHDLYNIRYTGETDPEASKVITFYPQDVAAYLAITKDQRKKHNWTPLEMNPFALPSKHQAQFYRKLCNNIVIYDPSLDSKDKLRKLHLDEKCIFLARGIKKFGHDDFCFWDRDRDGKLKDYDWSIPGGK